MSSPFQAVNVDCNFEYPYEAERCRALGGELVLRKAVTEDEIIAAGQNADVLIVEGAKTPINARVIGALPKCRLIVKYAVGVDNVDLPTATARGIVVANAADYCTEEVSDHAVALILAASRRVAAADRYVRGGKWTGFTPNPPLRRMSELTLGLVGFGRIARATARKMAGFRMKMLAADPYLAGMAPEPGVEFVELPRLLQESDLVSVLVPLTPETRGLLNEAAFRSMKRNAVVVNTSRGPVIDERALVRALQEKWISGAALDVVEEEPLPAASPLRGMEQVILTPHIAANSEDSMRHARRTVMDSVEAVVRGYWPPFPVNPRTTPRSPLKPWKDLPRP